MSGDHAPDARPLADWLSAPLSEEKAAAFRAALPDYQSMAAFIDFMIARVWSRDHRSVFWGDRMVTLDKHAGFLDEPAFRAAFEAIKGAHVYDQYAAPDTIAWRLHTLVWAARQALALPEGDFVECGVFQGDMSEVVHSVAGIAASGRRMVLFDSFAGFSPETDEDQFPDMPGYIEFANRYYQQDGLYERVAARFSGKANVDVVRGYLPGALEGHVPERIGWLHLDLNVASAEIGCLEVLWDRIVPGGLIVLDDYGWKAYRLQKEQEDAWFAARGYHVLELPTGQGLVVKL